MKQNNLTKKNILIFTSGGGRGHISATEALKEYLADYQCNITVNSIFTELFASFDIIRKITVHRFNGEQLYNWLIKKKWYRTINFFYIVGAFFFSLQKYFLAKTASSYIQQQRPDLIISVIPLVNGALVSAAEKNNIPLLLIPTDLDYKTFIIGIKSPCSTLFHITIPFDEPALYQLAYNINVPKENIHLTGFPVRTQFLTSKNRNIIREKFILQVDRLTVLVMLGGVGSESLLIFAQALSKVAHPIHLFLCLGKSNDLAKKIHSIHFPSHITIDILGFTNHVDLLMSAADVCFTKSGSVSFSEAIYSETPMILDATTSPLRWEKRNHVFATSKEFGWSITNLDQLIDIINTAACNPAIIKQKKQNLAQYSKPDPSQRIPHCIKKILSS